MSLVQQALDPDLLAWLQADPAFSDLHKLFTESAFYPGECLTPEERGARQKYEESGYGGDTAPNTAVINQCPQIHLADLSACGSSCWSSSIATRVGWIG